MLRAFLMFLRRRLSAIFVIAGLLLLGYVVGEYGQMYWQQRQLQRQWEAQQNRTAAPDTQQDASANASPHDALTRLTIPRIDLAAVVVEGTSHKSLLLGPGHMEETPAPGETGNSVISAHRDTFFRHIYELHKGDEVVVQRNGKTYRYEVTGKKIVQPDDMSVLSPSKDKRLTLITCYPTYYIGPAPERLVVTSKLVDGQSDSVSSSSVKKTASAASRAGQ